MVDGATSDVIKTNYVSAPAPTYKHPPTKPRTCTRARTSAKVCVEREMAGAEGVRERKRKREREKTKEKTKEKEKEKEGKRETDREREREREKECMYVTEG